MRKTLLPTLIIISSILLLVRLFYLQIIKQGERPAHFLGLFQPLHLHKAGQKSEHNFDEQKPDDCEPW